MLTIVYSNHYINMIKIFKGIKIK